MISFLARIIVALNSNSRPGELASGAAFGLWLALIPGGNLLWTILFVTAFFLKHNLAAVLLCLAGFRLIVPAADPLLDRLGAAVLEHPALQEFFTSLYNIPLMPWMRFNNTIVMGGFLTGLLLWLPLFLLVLFLVKFYRKKVASKLADSKLIRRLKKVPFISKLSSAVRKASVFA